MCVCVCVCVHWVTAAAAAAAEELVFRRGKDEPEDFWWTPGNTQVSQSLLLFTISPSLMFLFTLFSPPQTHTLVCTCVCAQVKVIKKKCAAVFCLAVLQSRSDRCTWVDVQTRSEPVLEVKRNNGSQLCVRYSYELTALVGLRISC